MDKLANQDTIVSNTPSDREVIGKILQGERDLYAVIMRRYNQRLYRVGMSILGNDADIEDAMQVAYINAYENLDKFAFKSAFSTWLTRILINECLLRLKKKKQSIYMSEEIMNSEAYQNLGPEVQTPVGKILHGELKAILEKAIRELPEKYRAVFVMRELENMNVAETGDCLHISESNVKVRLNRARALLKDSLSSYYNNDHILHFHLLRCDRIVDRVMSQINGS